MHRARRGVKASQLDATHSDRYGRTYREDTYAARLVVHGGVQSGRVKEAGWTAHAKKEEVGKLLGPRLTTTTSPGAKGGGTAESSSGEHVFNP